MRKYFEDLSSIGGVLVFVSILFGSFLRLYDLNLIGHWSDELATLYYSKNLSLVFFEETHPPGFYFLTKILFFFTGESVFALRAFVAGLNVSLNILNVFIAKKIFNSAGWVIFVILLFLLPVDIAYARIGRMYSLLISLSMSFFLLCHKDYQDHYKLPVLSFIMSWLFPIGFLPGMTLIVYNLLRYRKINKVVMWLVASIAPVFCYYISKFLFLEKKGFINDYLGGDYKVRSLFLDFFYTMAGDHIPKFSIEQLWPYAWILFATFSLFVSIIVLIKSKKKSQWLLMSDYYLILFFFTILFVYLFSASMINIKLGRYLVFLIPPLCIQGIILGEWENRKYNLIGVGLFSSLLTYQMLVYEPFKIIPWEREAFKEFESYRTTFNIPQNYVFCGNRFQYYFYFKSEHKHCMLEYERFKSKKENFVFIDMNGFVREGIFDIAKDYQVSDLKFMGMSTLAVARYRDKKIK